MATINAASASRTDVQAAIDSSSNGDTVVVPAGSATWTSVVTISSKYITLQGAGIGATVITDGVSKDPFPNVPQMLVWNTIDGGLTRLTGFTFQGGSITDANNAGMVAFDGTSHQFRLDHCRFVPTKTSALFFGGYIWGVIDHNTFDVSANNGFGVYTFHNIWNVPASAYGDASWADITDHGTSRALFFEDNTFLNDQTNGLHYYACDGWMGGRVVYRYNTFTNTTWANHGTESGGRQRSQRSYEVYNNTFTLAGGVSFPSFIGSRGGVGVVTANTGTTSGGATVTVMHDLQYYRAGAAFSPWGQATGVNVWDENTNARGYRCLDQTGVGQGDLISGDTPLPETWPNQAVDPTYTWSNTINGVASNSASNVPTVVEIGRDAFNSAKGGWAAYTYPHPLIGGGGTGAVSFGFSLAAAGDVSLGTGALSYSFSLAATGTQSAAGTGTLGFGFSLAAAGTVSFAGGIGALGYGFSLDSSGTVSSEEPPSTAVADTLASVVRDVLYRLGDL